MRKTINTVSLKVGDRITTDGDGSSVDQAFTGVVHTVGDKCYHVYHPTMKGKWFTKKAQRAGYKGSCAIKKNNSIAWVEIEGIKKTESINLNKQQNGKNISTEGVKIRRKAKIVG